METVELSYQTHQNTDVKSQMFLRFIMIVFIINLADTFISAYTALYT